MRRKLVLGFLAVFAVLTTAGPAAAANWGFTPPAAHSPNADRINQAYYLIAGFTFFIFLVVEGSLIAFLVKYRSRNRDRSVEGAQLHGHTRLELIWTAIPVAIITIIFGFVFYKLPGIKNPPSAQAAGEHINIKIDSHQFYWQFTYPNGAISIDTLHLPVDRVAVFQVTTQDVQHSWWIPNLGGKVDAIPGKTNTIWYQPKTIGRFYGQCAELCGLFHERMRATVVVEDRAAYDRFVNSGWRRALGRAEWEGACAKCHGMQGQGDFGPALASNPLLTQRAPLESIVRHGRGRMPAVGNNWRELQFRALIEYTKSSVYKGGGSGGG